MRWKDNTSGNPEECVRAFPAGNPVFYRADEDESDCDKGEEDVPGVFLERHYNKFRFFPLVEVLLRCCEGQWSDSQTHQQIPLSHNGLFSTVNISEVGRH